MALSWLSMIPPWPHRATAPPWLLRILSRACKRQEPEPALPENSPARVLLALGSFDARVSVWVFEPGKRCECLHVIDNHDANGVVISPDCAQMVMTVAEDKAEALEFGLAGPQVIHHFDLKAGAITGLAMDARGARLIAACELGTVTIFDARTFRVERCLKVPGSGFSYIMASLSSSGNLVAASGREKAVWLWDLEEGEQAQPKKLQADLDKVTSIAFNADASLVAVALRDSTTRVHCTKTLEEKYRCCGHKGVVHSAAFLRNGRLVTGSRDATAKLWQGQTCVHTFVGHSASVNAVSVTPDGAYLVTGSEDSTAKIWSLSTPELDCVHTLECHVAGLSTLACMSEPLVS